MELLTKTTEIKIQRADIIKYKSVKDKDQYYLDITINDIEILMPITERKYEQILNANTK